MHQTTNQITHIVKSYLSTLIEMGIPVERAYLFGSQAKGTAKPDSDIDLIVVSSAFTNMPLWKRWEILGDALAKIMEPIEVQAYTQEEIDFAQKRKASFIHEVLNEPQTIEYQF